MRSRSDQGARRRAAVLVALGLVGAVPGAMAVDLSGHWRMTLGQFPITLPVTLVQDDTVLTGTIGVGIDDGPGRGTIDPATGAFALVGAYTVRPGIPKGPPEITCDYELVASADLDGGRFVGRLDDSCGVHTTVEAVRLRCGNGAVDPGEACDAAFPCCTSACELAPANEPCTDDGNPCTTDQCDAAGACQHALVPAGTGCGDDSRTCRRHACIGDGRCVAADVSCPACEVCVAGRCYPTTSLVCSPPSAGAAVDLHAPALGRRRLHWTWEGGAPTTGDFGDPQTGAQFGLCVYVTTTGGVASAGTTVPPGGTCGDHPCWSAHAGGFTYANPGDGAGTGVRVMRLATRNGLQRIRVAAAGRRLGLPDDLDAERVVVQLVKPGPVPACWEATFTAPLLRTPTRFRARR